MNEFRLLASYRFHVDIFPEDEGGFTLWLRELNVAGTGPSLRQARQDLLAAVRSYVRDYIDQFDFYRHLTDLAAQEPYVARLSLTQDNAELLSVFFGQGMDDHPQPLLNEHYGRELEEP